MRRDVANFNRRRQTAIKAGLKSVPEKAYVSELKRRYDTRSDLDKELKLLNAFRRDSLAEIENSGGAKSIEWDLQHIKANIKQAKEFYDKESEILSARVGRFPGERDRLDTINRNREVLNYDLDYLDQEQFDSVKGSIAKYIRARNKMGAGYRGFLAEVDEVMNRVGIEENDKKVFFNKIKKLDQEDFFYLYENSDLIRRIYDLLDSPIKGKSKMNASDEDARGYIDTLMDETDMLILEVQSRK